MHLISLITQGFILKHLLQHVLLPNQTYFLVKQKKYVMGLDFIHHDWLILVGRGWKVTRICVGSEQSVFRVEAMRQGGVAERYCGGKMKLSRLLFDCVWFTGPSLPSSWLFYNVVSLSPYLSSFSFPLSFHTSLHFKGWMICLFTKLLPNVQVDVTLIYKQVTQECLYGVSTKIIVVFFFILF